MKSTPIVATLALLLAASHLACSGAAPKRPTMKYGSGALDQGSGGNGGKTPGTGAPDDEPITNEPRVMFQLGDVQQDAADYTFGSMKLVSKNAASLELKTKRFLSVSDPSALKPEEESALKKLCRDIELSESATESTAAKESGASGEALHLFWRSFYSANLKAVIADLVTSGEDIRCVLKVESLGEKALLPYYLVFDPIPADEALIGGSAKVKDAVSLGLMMPFLKEKYMMDETKLVAVDAEPEVLVAIEALKKDDVKLTAEAGMAASCLLHPTKPGTVVNPTQDLTTRAKIEGAAAVAVGAFSLVPIDGRVLKSCEEIKPKEVAKGIEAGLNCEIYQKIKNEGVEAGCQWDVEILNEKDPQNSVAARIGLNKVSYNTFNVKQVDSALDNIPKSARNPVVTKAINFRGFNEGQLASMEQMFDLWLAVEPNSYDEDVDGFMKNITREACQSGVLGYAGLRSANFTICDLASLSASALNKTNDPIRPIIQLITTSHEVRHAVKWRHDKDDRSYPPCGGSAASAVTMHAIAGKCDMDYCLVLKSMAIREFRAELNYSLAQDSRKYQGQCKAWTDELGVSL